jgi:hypothetical protein
MSRWTVDHEKTKPGNTRNDSGASDEPLHHPNELASESVLRALEGEDDPGWQLPDIARLSVLRIPDIESAPTEEALIYHTEKFDVPILMDFSLAYPEASRAKL